MGRRGLLGLLCLAALIAGFTSVASACRVRRPPSLTATGIPKVCSSDFTVAVRRAGKTPERIAVRLDHRTLVSTRDHRFRVRVPCRRLSPGLHRLEVNVRNSGGTNITHRFPFTAR